jgi:hypothetical protein
LGQTIPRGLVLGWLTRYAARLRFPVLFVVVALLFVIDLIVPDFIPLADEVLLGLLTVLLGMWKQRRDRVVGKQPGS